MKLTKPIETLKRTLVKSLTYRVIHFIIHLSEVFIGAYLLSVFGPMGAIAVVGMMQAVCWIHYIIHERIFSRFSWGYKLKSECDCN